MKTFCLALDLVKILYVQSIFLHPEISCAIRLTLLDLWQLSQTSDGWKNKPSFTGKWSLIGLPYNIWARDNAKSGTGVFLCCNTDRLILSQLGDPSDFVFELSMRFADFTAVSALKLVWCTPHFSRNNTKSWEVNCGPPSMVISCGTPKVVTVSCWCVD